ncbi:hypothetical protein EYR36_009929 [Pleurotus pulmonarius]|nr:hypothetical protein EYR36_009929 [Pleurotus pulmonarius]KAF4593407.1 hypothetical protein EYR38_009121 [Pleurotus pulmonarius]
MSTVSSGLPTTSSPALAQGPATQASALLSPLPPLALKFSSPHSHLSCSGNETVASSTSTPENTANIYTSRTAMTNTASSALVVPTTAEPTASAHTLPGESLGFHGLFAMIDLARKSGDIKEDFAVELVGLLKPWASQFEQSKRERDLALARYICAIEQEERAYAELDRLREHERLVGAEQSLSDLGAFTGFQEVDGRDRRSDDDDDSISPEDSVSRCCSPEL